MDKTKPAIPSPFTASLEQARSVERLVKGQATSDGDGVRLVRVLTQDLQRRLDPFLMLDAFGSSEAGDYIGGFPAHPHRGFETITYMLQGRMRHRDSAGNVGLLVPGSVQWMTAGRGVIHSEMPEQEDGAMEGFQFWLNLPAKEKMCEPWYRDIPADQLPRWQGAGVTAVVIAGQVQDVAGAVQREHSQALIVDLQLEPHARFQQPLPAAHNAFFYVFGGSASVGGTEVPLQRMAVLADARKTTPVADHVAIQAGPDGARALLVAGQPLNEPIAQHGPFVMNTHEQLVQAVRDFQQGKLAPTLVDV